jgi:hypothetical protein
MHNCSLRIVDKQLMKLWDLEGLSVVYLLQPIPSIYLKPSGESKKYVPITTPRLHIPTPRIKTTNSPYRTVSRAGERQLHRTASFHLHPVQVDYEGIMREIGDVEIVQFIFSNGRGNKRSYDC